jgi:hypothetical protein
VSGGVALPERLADPDGEIFYGIASDRQQNVDALVAADGRADFDGFVEGRRFRAGHFEQPDFFAGIRQHFPDIVRERRSVQDEDPSAEALQVCGKGCGGRF